MKAVRTARRFVRGLSTNLLGSAGVALTTSAFILFSLAEVLRLSGVLDNAYIGLITYMALPALFVLGLLLIPAGWWLYRRRTGRTTRELLAERFDEELVQPRAAGSRLVRIVVGLTLVNLLFLGAGAGRMLHFMDQPVFCGTACHSVMGPEWAVYQDSPHARVKCVECHVGSGAKAAFDAKLNGMWQMISVTFDLYERPIPTPVHNLRPARHTCERCHWPAVFYGQRIKRISRYADDRASTPRHTTLALKVGSGAGERRGEIHWHVAPQNEVRYLAADPKRLTMRWVEVRQADGSYRRYQNRALGREAFRTAGQGGEATAPKQVRTLDCVDCHNRATHIYEDPEDVVDRLIESGTISRELPYAKRRALAALTGDYPPGEALEGIARDFRGAYRRDDPGVLQAGARQIDRAVAALQAAHRRNIHPGMNVGWNPYPNHLGHRGSPGCDRCHNAEMRDAEGRAVPHDCTLCHSMLAYDSPRPFEFLQPPARDKRQNPMGRYLRDEFLGTPAPSLHPAIPRPLTDPAPSTPDAAGEATAPDAGSTP